MKSTRKECKLQFADLLLDRKLSKRGWGVPQDYEGGNPHGCPGVQRGIKQEYRPDGAPDVDQRGMKQEYRPDGAPDVDQRGMKQEYRLDRAPDVVAAVDGEGEAAAAAPEGASHLAEGSVKKKQKKKQGPKKLNFDPVPSVFQREASEANRAARRNTMKLKLCQISSDLPQFKPDAQDKEFEQLYIVAPSMTTRNKKFRMAVTDLADLRPESIQAMKEGRLPDKPDDRYVSGTWKNNLSGARNLMTLWMKDLGLKTIHYRQFLAFGREDLLKPRNVLELLADGMHTGNDKMCALTAYQMILTAQLEESRKAELSFVPLIQDSKLETLTAVQIQDKCSKLAETFRSSVTNMLAEFKEAKAQGGFRNEQDQRHNTGLALKERLLGSNVLNPSETVRMYIEDSSVIEQRDDLIASASDSSLIPTGKQMKKFANTVLVQLMIKNCSRKEVFVKLTREEFLEAKAAGVKVVQYVPNEDLTQTQSGAAASADGLEVRTANVYDLGEDIGSIRMVMRPVQKGKSEDPSEQGLVLEKKLHKTAQTGVAYVFLSLPDLVLMDSYSALAIRYCEAQKPPLPYGHDSSFFITPRGKEVHTVDFSQFCKISGYPEFTSHQARKVFASWVATQKSQRLSECATFAAKHSLAIQQSHYVSSDAKRVQALEALTYYQRAIVGGQKDQLDQLTDDESDEGDETVVNMDYEQKLKEDLAAVKERKWKEALERERRRDEREKVTLDRYVTQNVRFNAVSLIRGLGSDQKFVSACGGIDVLQYFLGEGAHCQNLTGRSLLLTMLDWDPLRADAQVLLGNLYLVCSLLDSGTRVNAVEHDWAAKVVRSVYNLSSDSVFGGRLPLRLRTLLLELNEVSDWKYCAGNHKLEQLLRAFQTSRDRNSGGEKPTVDKPKKAAKTRKDSGAEKPTVDKPKKAAKSRKDSGAEKPTVDKPKKAKKAKKAAKTRKDSGGEKPKKAAKTKKDQ